MLSLKSVRYVGYGNIPAAFAHSIQMMKMAEAFSQEIGDFALYTQCHPFEYLPGRRFPYENHYGIRHPFQIVRFPSRAQKSGGLYTLAAYPGFDRFAQAAICFRRPHLTITRNLRVARGLVERGLPCIVEAHINEQSPGFLDSAQLFRHPKIRGIITISSTLSEQLHNAGVPPIKILVWPDAVDPAEFDPAPRSAHLRQQLNIAGEDPIVMYVGQFYPGKGADIVVGAARLLKNVCFVLVGGHGEDFDRVRMLSLGTPNVYLAGQQPRGRIPAYMSCADLLVLPTEMTALATTWLSPMKLFEYMAAQRAIVATDLPFVRPILHEANAIFVRADSSRSLADGIRHLLLRPELARTLALRARKDVMSYTWRERARAILEWSASRAASSET